MRRRRQFEAAADPRRLSAATTGSVPDLILSKQRCQERECSTPSCTSRSATPRGRGRRKVRPGRHGLGRRRASAGGAENNSSSAAIAASSSALRLALLVEADDEDSAAALDRERPGGVLVSVRHPDLTRCWLISYMR